MRGSVDEPRWGVGSGAGRVEERRDGRGGGRDSRVVDMGDGRVVNRGGFVVSGRVMDTSF